MKIKDQCCSLAQAKELKKLGVKQDSLFYHFPNPNTEATKKKYKIGDYNILPGTTLLARGTTNIKSETLNDNFTKTFSAFTVAELSVMLGDHYPSWSFNFPGKGKRWIATAIIKDKHKDGKTITTERSFDRYAKTQAQALAQLLLATIRVGHIQVSTINKRLK